ncbi:DinB family protein [Christiangramia gaetbulicola]|uniref:DinB family protein n=1 Tax=Christiangramia gaetbulicola TaxID=703340 RepID=A0A2T6AK29_9FLAO|nr:DinB family protein [Christiangramia gaetbulicola]PTX44168.1 DinB family protein [Christiangramia gaetbulicola]
MNRWSGQIDKVTEDFLNSFTNLTEEELNWKPDAGTWSIAENIDHLIQVNKSYFPILEKLIKGNYRLPFIARFGFVVRFFGNMILKSVQPDRTKKVKTFPLWEPKKSHFSRDILNSFEEHQKQLKAEILKVDDKVRENAVISSPINKNIVYKLETAFDIIVSHEKRHYEQAEEVYQLLKVQKNKSS